LEPPIDELLADTLEGQRVRDEWIKAFEPIRTAALAGDAVRAAKLFFDLANNQGSEAFDKQPETFRQVVLDNARTIPLQLLARNPDDLADSVCHCPADGTWRRSVGVRVQ
jgi:hypothetical protein